LQQLSSQATRIGAPRSLTICSSRRVISSGFSFESSRTGCPNINDTRPGRTNGMKNLLFAVAEYFGISYDKWSSENLRISFDRKGHKKE
jgi:hypothetical protein